MNTRKETDAQKQKRIANQIDLIAAPLCETEGLEMVLVEYQREPAGRILRIYIDKPGGVTLDDCAKFSRQLSDLLDIHLESDETYNLEVSSPGIDRPLVKKSDFDRFKASMVKIKTDQPINGQRNFKGELLGISGDDVMLMVDNERVRIAYPMIQKARLVNNS